MKRLATLAVTACLLLLPGAAFANSTCQQYSSLCSVVSNASTNKNASTSSASTLPFTGLDVVLLAAGGAVLLAGGLVVRRLSRPVE